MSAVTATPSMTPAELQGGASCQPHFRHSALACLTRKCALWVERRGLQPSTSMLLSPSSISHNHTHALTYQATHATQPNTSTQPCKYPPPPATAPPPAHLSTRVSSQRGVPRATDTAASNTLSRDRPPPAVTRVRVRGSHVSVSRLEPVHLSAAAMAASGMPRHCIL